MFANARAIAKLAAMGGDKAMAAEFAARADAIRARVLQDLWSPDLTHFIDRYQVDNGHVNYWSPIRARELVGYLPWMFDLPPDDPGYAQSWRHLLSPQGFAGKAGMRTVEPSYEYYMRQYRYLGTQPECQWNGPIWPYQTTQVLLGMANLLDHYSQSVVTRSDYMRLLRQYTALHYQGDRLDLEEDYHPETGKPIVGLDRSHHYFHSGYIDLILTGVVGIRPRADNVLEVDPLIPDASDPQAMAWFRAQDVPYHGRRVAVTWDADGSHYGRGAGLSIEVDGHEVARRKDLGRLTVPIAGKAAPSYARPVDLAVQLVRGKYPKGTASSNADSENVHDAIDGRVWFFPELPNGWSSAPSPAQQWYMVDFGKPTRVSRAELAFFEDAVRYAAPDSYRIQTMVGDEWRDIQASPATNAVANGITHVQWPAVTTTKVRILFRQRAGRASRLVEFKLF
jgi:hypothetical protein